VAGDSANTWSEFLISKVDNDAEPHSIVQPSFAVLKLIKL